MTDKAQCPQVAQGKAPAEQKQERKQEFEQEGGNRSILDSISQDSSDPLDEDLVDLDYDGGEPPSGAAVYDLELLLEDPEHELFSEDPSTRFVAVLEEEGTYAHLIEDWATASKLWPDDDQEGDGELWFGWRTMTVQQLRELAKRDQAQDMLESADGDMKLADLAASGPEVLPTKMDAKAGETDVIQTGQPKSTPQPAASDKEVRDPAVRLVRRLAGTFPHLSLLLSALELRLGSATQEQRDSVLRTGPVVERGLVDILTRKDSDEWVEELEAELGTIQAR